MKPKMHIASCSFGKDSIATILLALENGEPLDRVVFAEVMFDHARNISGEIPEHIAWVYGTAIPKMEEMGVVVDVVRAKKDYVYYFTNHVKKGGKYEGKISGFPIGGRCYLNKDCKVVPIREYCRSFQDVEIVEYIGIAKDEPKRLARLKKNKISLLDKYGYTEKMAMAKCEEYGLISPLYNVGQRGGCWFCMNNKIQFYVHLRKEHPELWNELRELSKTPNLCCYGFKYGKTVQEVEKQMDEFEFFNKRQLNLFEV